MTDVDISPADVQRAAAVFAEGQGRIGSAWDALEAALVGCAGMAGHHPDKSALTFAPRYDKAVAAAWHAFSACITSVGGMSLCLGKTAGNYLNADHHSTITTAGRPGTALMPPQPAELLFPSRTQVVAGKTLPVPPPALGTGGSSLPGPIARAWPTADTDKLRAAEAAWNQAHTGLSAVALHLGGAIGSITDGNDTTDAEAITHVWSRLYSPCNDTTVLSALIDLCAAIARACGQYAKAVDHARHTAEWELAAAALPGVLILGAGIFLTPETGGASDAGAASINIVLASSIILPIATALLVTVTALVLGALAQQIIQATEDSAAHAPKVQPTDADTQSLQKSLGDELGRNNTNQDPDPRDLETKPRKIAQDMGYSTRQINDAIHSVKRQGAWRGIEANRNPDITVDTKTGEVYPKTPNGGVGDSIGNILDYLPDQ